ncbi:sensor histidine kinase [Candidatus Ruminimicrobiellum ovillum]|uniref:sensor histidine kinase n=1 Tax=Candidatus Ruminimicrobiellum ovillum TaxID=1947927 RepID=UPI00355A2D91
MGQNLVIKPYARLLTMLGEQLIKDESVALIELIKNSYDADAEKVNVIFKDFVKEDNNDNFILQKTNKSQIILEDSGTGMTKDILLNHWLNPATPIKKEIKKNKKQSKTEKGRIIQGEKGIGRFSLFKLGRKVTIITRPKGVNKEYKLQYDFSQFNNDFYDDNKDKYMFLDDIKVFFDEQKPTNIVKASDKIWEQEHGTKIIIEEVNGKWDEKKLLYISKNIRKMRPLFELIKKDDYIYSDFVVDLYIDDGLLEYQRNKEIEKLRDLLEDKPVFKITDGYYDDKKREFLYKLNSKDKVLSLDNVFKKALEKRGELLPFSCGPFKFEFYIFDLSNLAPIKFKLDKEDKESIKDNRVYLYRDGIRVYPYGEKEDDWLGIDISRGTQSLSGLFSNDQIIGCVYISQEHNPLLQDKTSREGLTGNGAFEDLIFLLKCFLSYLRSNDFAKYKITEQKKTFIKNIAKGFISSEFDKLNSLTGNNKQINDLVIKIKKLYENENKQFVNRIDTAEALAGVGLSVETATHDINLFMNRAMDELDTLIYYIDSINETSEHLKFILKELLSLKENFSFIQNKLENVQLLFKSSNRKKKDIVVKDILDKIISLFSKSFSKNNIRCEICGVENKKDFIVNISDAILMQVFINLLDNSVYWLNYKSYKEQKEIRISFNIAEKTIAFSDNGPGISPDDEDFIFEAFFSGKGEKGRGLGLYIARQLLEKNDFSINLSKEKILPGANFIIDFNPKENISND